MDGNEEHNDSQYSLGSLPRLHQGIGSFTPPLLLYHQCKCLSIIMKSFDFTDPKKGLNDPQSSVDQFENHCVRP